MFPQHNAWISYKDGKMGVDTQASRVELRGGSLGSEAGCNA